MKIIKEVFVYSIKSEEIPAEVINIPQGDYLFQMWRPSMRSITPKGLLRPYFVAWWFFHQFRVFANRDYCIFVAYNKEILVHYSPAFPKYFRFPFMSPDDLQIGSTWTAPEYRRKGLATFAIQKIIESEKKRGRRFWYICKTTNIPSIRVVEKTGFIKAGVGHRFKRFGMKLFGSFLIQANPANSDILKEFTVKKPD